MFWSFYKIYSSQILNKFIFDSNNKLSASLISFNTLLYCFLKMASWLQIYPSLFSSWEFSPSIFILLFYLKFLIYEFIAFSNQEIIYCSCLHISFVRLVDRQWLMFSISYFQLQVWIWLEGSNFSVSSIFRQIERTPIKHFLGYSDVRKSFSLKMFDIDFM